MIAQLSKIIPTVIIVCINFRETIMQPYSVTSFPGLEHFYLQQRTQNAGAPPQLLTVDSKWAVCTKIFRRRTHLVQPLYALVSPLDHQDELVNDVRYRSILNEIFVPIVRSNAESPAAAGSSRHYMYTNASRERAIFVDGNAYPENVFTCLTIRRSRDLESTTIKPYYVSHDHYNVNEVAGGRRIFGRFVFSYDEENKLVVHALAEEYAQMLRYNTMLELEYYYVAKFGVRASAAEDDPICQLDYGRRLRLCSSLFEGYRWAPFVVVVDGRCELIQFVVNENTVLSEWAIYCRTQGYLRFTYRISRSYTDNEVFVYDNGARGLQLAHCFNNIGVVKDSSIAAVSFDERGNQGVGSSSGQPLQK